MSVIERTIDYNVNGRANGLANDEINKKSWMKNEGLNMACKFVSLLFSMHMYDQRPVIKSVSRIMNFGRLRVNTYR